MGFATLWYVIWTKEFARIVVPTKRVFFIIPGFRTGDGRTVMKIKTLQEKEYDLVEKVLKDTGWNLEKARRLLQIPLSQLKMTIRKHGMKNETSVDITEPKNDLELKC